MTRILRYLGNREKPEAELHGRVDLPIQRRAAIEPITYDVNDPKIPNLLKTGMKKEGDLFVPASFTRDPFEALSTSWFQSYFTRPSVLGFWGVDNAGPEKPKDESPFEVNMMEALVGWKALSVEDGKIYSASMAGISWPIDEPLVAVCKNGKDHKDSPYEHCSCGIYASERREGAEDYRHQSDPEDFLALVYGWGKYVRGNSGWRSQYAYPKCFYLEQSQALLVESLKAYHVPIYIEQPTLIYNPEEDGYEHREEATDWNCGAAEESAASEERDFEPDED